MEKKYESLTLFEFQEKFPDNDSWPRIPVRIEMAQRV